MTPYGIVYRDNPYALQKSVEIWQKKYGVFNIPTFLKIGALSTLMLIPVTILLAYMNKEDLGVFFIMFAGMIILTFVLIYMVVNNTYVKQMSLTNAQKEDKQIVLYEDRLEYGTGYTKAIYYYRDIVYCCECADIITIITDTAAIPLSVQKASVKKGDYQEFSNVLRRCAGTKYEYMGGKK